jgi:hypothetical protein
LKLTYGDCDLKQGRSYQLLHGRLELATEAELKRMCQHLSIGDKSSVEEIIKGYLDAADNTIINVVRPVVPSDAPTYSKILRLIYRQLRSYAEGLDETWRAVKSLKPWKYQSPIDEMTDDALEEKIFKMYAAEFSDIQKKLIADPSLWNKLAGYIPGVTTATASTAVTIAATTARRFPFAAAAPSAMAGPVGIALSVVLLGFQAAGPAYRKIIPATVELMIIGRRIQYLPAE